MDKMAISRKGLRLMLAGVLVMAAGYILLSGPSPVQDHFNWAMFDARRLVAAPLVIIAGIITVGVAIMGRFDDKKEEK